ncbi:acyl-CoA reductase [Schinkia azotoformans]|uniref:acyl-CoA reductase n=1 Tax=Schinkia azotoformans TaxID=1454 RepID=UPI002E1BA9A2|nr:acyl-CoA reductase [Schinkia azotoformans]MED4350946.1 acyl-CoA reductase [Schinkia azotoformans]
MKCLIPNVENWQSHFEVLVKLPFLKMFDDRVIHFLNDLSKQILTNKRMRQYPELMATGFWLRKGHIQKLKGDFRKRLNGGLILPRGVVFHIAPSNVDSIFLYSWVLSLLAGNSNIIRLSTRQDEQLLVLLELIERTLANEEYSELKKRNMVVSYPHDDEITKMFSNQCHVRVIWGGDATIKGVRAIPLKPIATELVFADRFSSVVLSAEQVLRAGDADFEQLIHHFYNDAFWFQQMACSSPRMVTWIGGMEQVDQAQSRLWKAVQEKLEQQKHSISAALHMTRLSTAYYYGAQAETDTVTVADSSSPLRIEMNDLNKNIREVHCGGGIFLEMAFASLAELASIFNEKDQTLTYYGFNKNELAALVMKLQGRGIDRIVPVGQALDFHEIWDGYHLLTYFTREIDLR